MINVIEIFCGAGGLGYGFHKDNNFNVMFSTDFDENAIKAYSLNYPDTEVLCSDIRDINSNILNKFIGKTDIILGGPPCQSYSTIGKRECDDRANLFMEYKRVLSILKPKLFVFENVVGILSMNGGLLFKQVLQEFNDIGYNVKYKVINAVNYGVPQFRERVILVGMLGENIFKYPDATYGDFLLKYVTLSDAIGDLPIIKSGESADYYLHEADNDFLRFVRDSDVLTEHKSPKNNNRLIKIMNTLKDGQSKSDLPEEIRPKSGYGNTYAKLWWNKPAATITRNFACPSSSRCIHPRDSRAMSIREGARLQSFPDSYKFYGSDCAKRLQIGNAVPPLLSVAIAKEVSRCMDRG